MPTKRRPPGDGTLFKNAKGYWVGGIELPAGLDGKRRTKRIVRKNRNDAITALRKIRADYEAGTLTLAPTTTLGAWIDHWFTTIHTPRIKPTTAQSYTTTIERHIKPTLGTKRLDRLQPADVRRLYVQLQTEISTRAAQKADQVLRLAIAAAVREGILGRNTMDRVTKPEHTKAEQHAIDPATAVHLIRTADTHQGTMWATRWLAGFLIGARESEILGLEWQRIDLDGAVADISWQLQRLQKHHGCGTPTDNTYPCGKTRSSYCPNAHWSFPPGMPWRECAGTLVWTRPKTKSGTRLVPLTPLMVEALRRIESDNPHDLVFHEDGKPISQDRDQKQWRALLKAAEVPHMPQHSLRHSTATMALALGISDHVVQSRIGHSDITTTRGYQHVDLTLAAAEWRRLDGLFVPKALD